MFDESYFITSLASLNEKVFNSYEELSKEETEYLDKLIDMMKVKTKTYSDLLSSAKKLGMYNNFKANELMNNDKEEALNHTVNRKLEDENMIANARRLVDENNMLKDYMFGYPANNYDVDPVEEDLRKLESQLPYMNNCGDSSTKTRGNYVMDSKEYEEKILNSVFKNLNVNENEYWGYITSGGTEGNFWGLRTGFELFPKGKLYFSTSTHYSVPKFVRLVDNKNNPSENINIFPNEEVPSLEDGRVNADILINRIVENYKKDKTPAIVLLNWGTTVVGAIYDVKYITSTLDKLGIPHYVHLDAALFGGIAKNQEDAPSIKDLNDLNVDSVSISLHKYIGSFMTNGVLICKRSVLDKKNNLQIEYTGQEDPTYLGSRSVLPFTTYYRIKKLYERTDSKQYKENIEFFKEYANEKGLEYQVHGNSNIFVVRINNSFCST